MARLSSLILCQQNKMVGMLVKNRITILHGSFSKVRFHPNNWFDALSCCRSEKVDHAKHGSVVGNTDRWHTQFFDPFDETANVAEPVQQGVFGMDVKMDERHAVLLVSKLQ